MHDNSIEIHNERICFLSSSGNLFLDPRSIDSIKIAKAIDFNRGHKTVDEKNNNFYSSLGAMRLFFDACIYRLTFGKHKGKSILDVFIMDQQYLKWIYSEDFGDFYNQFLDQFFLLRQKKLRNNLFVNNTRLYKDWIRKIVSYQDSRDAITHLLRKSIYGEELSFFYLLVCDERESVKIGISGNPDKRLQAYKTCLKNPRIIFCSHGTLEEEKEIIRKYYCKKDFGDWFYLNSQDISLIKEYMNPL